MIINVRSLPTAAENDSVLKVINYYGLHVLIKVVEDKKNAFFVVVAGKAIAIAVVTVVVADAVIITIVIVAVVVTVVVIAVAIVADAVIVMLVLSF